MNRNIKKIVNKIAEIRYIHKPPIWMDIERFEPNWQVRIKEMASWIEDESSVLDLGCGPSWLKELISSNITYYGCDYIARGIDTIVCDFNKRQFPNVSTDLCFISGCLEYIDDIEWFISKVSAISNAVVISYCTIDMHPSLYKRKRAAWVNNLSCFGLTKMFIDRGFSLIKLDSIAGNTIFKFIKHEEKK